MCQVIKASKKQAYAIRQALIINKKCVRLFRSSQTGRQDSELCLHPPFTKGTFSIRSVSMESASNSRELILEAFKGNPSNQST